jgi:hypothetical protein
MTTFTDFKAGLQNANDYLDARHHLSGTTALGSDALRIVAKAEYSFTLRELLCGVLSGNGLKLPNLQICLHANISALLGLPNLQAELYSALNKLQNAVERFMDHTKIDNILGRLNSVLAEAQQLANLINFCSVSIDPIAIPNLLERAFGSFLGAGKAIIDSIGSMAPGDVCACIGTGGFNTNVFNGGILGQISSNFSAIAAGAAPRNIIDSIKNDINSAVGAITNIINLENNISGSYSNGGSRFGTPDGACNSEVGVMHNPGANTVAANARITSQLKSLYDSLAGYPVQYQYNTNKFTGQPLFGTGSLSGSGVAGTQGEVVEYPNIFHLLLEPEFLAKLQEDDLPRSDVSTQTPVYDYCGNIIGYTTNFVQRDNQKSTGLPPTEPSSPGYLAGGFETAFNDIPEDGVIASQTTQGDISNNVSGTRTIEFLDDSSILDLNVSDNFNKVVDSNTTFLFANVPTDKDKSFSFTIHLEHNLGSIFWPATVKWPAGITPAFLAGAYHLVKFTTYKNGSIWLGELIGSYPY